MWSNIKWSSTQKLMTIDGEVCHHYNLILRENGYPDALVIRKRVLTQRVSEYQNAGFVVIRRYKECYVVQQYISLKITTLDSLYHWTKDVYEHKDKLCY